MKQQKLISGFLIAALSGGLLGFLVQAGSTARWYSDWSLLSAFGTLSIGFFFWIALCTPIAFRARCGLHAALLTLTLLCAVLTGYVTAGWVFGGYINDVLLSAGLLLLLPAAFAAWILRAYRGRTALRIFAGAAGIFALLFDIRTRGYFSMPAMMLAMLLMAGYFAALRQAGRADAGQAAYRG